MKYFFSSITNIFLIGIFLLFSVNIHGQEKLLSYKEKVYAKEKTKNCQGKCPTIKLEIIEFNPKNKAGKLINENILDVICRMNYPEDHQIKNYKGLVDNFVEDYYQMSLDSLYSVYGYAYLNVSTNVSFQNSNVINLSMNVDCYYGGAHGNYGVFSMFFDPKTGHEIPLEKLFTDKEEFRQIAESFFRKEFKIPEQENINSPGFWFENDTFDISKNIVITQDKVTLFYNPYEIASYADGMLIVEIPMEKVKNLIIL